MFSKVERKKTAQMVRGSGRKRLCNCAERHRHILCSSRCCWLDGRKMFAQIPYRMVKCQAISHPVRNLKTGGSQIRAFSVRQFVQEKSVAARWSAGILSCPGGGATHR